MMPTGRSRYHCWDRLAHYLAFNIFSSVFLGIVYILGRYTIIKERKPIYRFIRMVQLSLCNWYLPTLPFALLGINKKGETVLLCMPGSV